MTDLDKNPKPGRRFFGLTILIAVIFALVGAGAIWSNATWSPKLALDLEGGTTIILEPQIENASVTPEQLDQAVEIIRSRVDSTGVSEAQITTQGDRNIVVSLPGNPDEETRNLVRSSAQLEFRRVTLVAAPGIQQAEPTDQPTDSGLSEEDQAKLDELLNNGAGNGDQATGGGEIAIPGGEASPAASEQSAESSQPGDVPAQVSATSGAEESAPAEDSQGDAGDAQVPRFDPLDQQSWATKEIIDQFSTLDCTLPENYSGGQAGPEDKPIVACAQDGSAKYVLGPVELAGSHVKDASFGFETTSTGSQTNNMAVTMEFDDTGRDVFAKMTTAITGQQMPYNQFAIVLDGNVLSAPASQTPVTDGRAQITGTFTQEQASTLANQLKNGALPISFQVQSEQQISPTLGSDYLKVGLITGVIGLLLVVVYSLLQYRVLGLVTVSSLVVAGILTYGLLLFVSWRYGYRLSLAGVAGIIIGIGMAADSFIVYFERVRDELRSGRKLLSAVEVGWDRARRTIYASKAVNMLAAVILYILAVGSVRGFAFTLGLTVIVDILVVVLFTHPMLQVLARTKFFGEGHPMSGMDPRQLGVKMAAYRGAMNLDLDKAKTVSTGKSHKEAKRRQAKMERKAAAASDQGPSLAERKAAKAAQESTKAEAEN